MRGETNVQKTLFTCPACGGHVVANCIVKLSEKLADTKVGDTMVRKSIEFEGELIGLTINHSCKTGWPSSDHSRPSSC